MEASIYIYLYARHMKVYKQQEANIIRFGCFRIVAFRKKRNRINAIETQTRFEGEMKKLVSRIIIGNLKNCFTDFSKYSSCVSFYH